MSCRVQSCGRYPSRAVSSRSSARRMGPSMSRGMVLGPSPLSMVECYSTANDSAAVDSDEKDRKVSLLLGDIGGTNCRFELVDADLRTRERLKDATFAKTFGTEEYPSFEEAIRVFLKQAGEQSESISSCCLAVAGPVVDNKCVMTNLKWVVDGRAIAQEFGFRTAVLNDFVAVGYAIPTLEESDLVTINRGERVEGGPVAVMGPGTGLGECQLMWDSGLEDYFAWASEGAHAGFAPRGRLQRELLEFAEVELQMPCEIEHVACGAGIQRIYRFLCQKRGVEAKPGYKPKDITMSGMAEECPICSEAVNVFLDIIGAEAGAMALRGMTTGGVYIAGGIPVRLMDRIEQGGVLHSFLNPESRFSKVTSRFPLYVLNKEVGLRGVFNFAMSLARRVMGPVPRSVPSTAGAHSVTSSADSYSTNLP